LIAQLTAYCTPIAAQLSSRSTLLAFSVVELTMKNLVLTLPTFGFIVSTRAALAFGVGLLVASRIPESRRRAIGSALVAIGAATTIPAVMTVLRNRFTHGQGAERTVPGVERDERLIGAERFPRKGDDE
jgi:hypothetical protein